MNDDTHISVKIEAVDADSLKDAETVQATVVGAKEDVLRFIAAAAVNTGATATTQVLQ